MKKLAQGMGLRSSILERDLEFRKSDCLSYTLEEVVIHRIPHTRRKLKNHRVAVAIDIPKSLTYKGILSAL